MNAARFELEAPAKINLRLEVLAREESGFHFIETLLCAISLADRLELRILDTPGLELRIEGAAPGPAETNLVRVAAEAFADATGLEPRWAFRLDKRIPAGAGLGGGSSDAAACLALLNHASGQPLDRRSLLRIAAGIGSDVPFFLAGSPFALAWGRGERLLPLPPPPARPVLVCMPAYSVATADAYARLGERRKDVADVPRAADIGPPAALSEWDSIGKRSRNDFEEVVFELHPDAEELRHALESHGAAVARLSGSGSAVFGVFERMEVRDEAAAHVASVAPDVALHRVETRRDVARIQAG